MATSYTGSGAARDALERVLGGTVLGGSPGLGKLLRFMVEKTLSGESADLKEYTLGVEALGRAPSFDPRADTIVRVQVRRLRAKLDDYYSGEGRSDPLVIRIPKGSYVPDFVEPGHGNGWPAPVRDAYEPDSIAHEHYLRGCYLAKGRTPKLLEAAEAFEKSLAIDSSYARAHAALADAYVSLSSYLLSPQEAMGKARSHAARALELDGSLAAAHVSLGLTRLLYDWDLSAAHRCVRRAIDADPYSARAHQLYAMALASQARFDEAHAQIRRAQELDPLSFELRHYGAWLRILGRDYWGAADECSRILADEPGFSVVRAVLGLALTLAGEPERGIDEGRIAMREEEIPWTVVFLQHSLALAGDRQAAVTLERQIRELADRHYLCYYEVGEANAVVDASDEAFHWLGQAVEQRSDCMVWLQVEPWLDGLRRDPRYESLVARTGLAKTDHT